MIAARPILDEYFAALVAIEPSAKKAALNTFNQAYFEIARAASWLEMRRSVQLAHGDLLPADLIAVDAVYDSDGYAYYPRDRGNVGMAERDPVRRWYFYNPVQTPLHRGTGLSVNKGSTTVGFGTSYTDLAGEWMVIPAMLGFWKLAGNTTLTLPWADESLTGQEYEIRPIGQQRLGLKTVEGGDATDTTVTVAYTAYPEPVTLTGGMIRLPSSEALLMRALRRHYKVDKKDLARGVSFNDEYDRALSEMLANNPQYFAPTIPVNRRGDTTWGASPR